MKVDKEYQDEDLYDILKDMENCIKNHSAGKTPNNDWFDGGISMTKHWRMRVRAYLKRKSEETYARG